MRTSDALAVFLASRKARGLSPLTIRWYLGILEVFAKQHPELPDNTDDIYLFLSRYPKVGDERFHGLYRALTALYNYLEKKYPGVPNPMRILEPPRRKPKQPRPLTLEELSQLLAFPHNSKIKAAILFLADTGCRVGEAASLQLNDLSETPWGYVARVSGKTGSRLVPISYQTYHSLNQVLPFGYTGYRFRRLVSQAFADARVQGSGINLRHTFGTYWDGDELVLQQIMGHSHLSTTKIYRALRTQRMSEQHAMYSPLRLIHSQRLL